MKLYYHPASTTSRIVMLCAAEEQIDLDYQVVDLFTEIITIATLAALIVYPQAFPTHKRRSDEAQAATLEWGKERSRTWLKVLDQDLIGPKRAYLCGDSITVADYLGAEMVGLGDLIRCNYSAYPNVERWMRGMKALKSWAKVHEVFYGFAGSLKDTPFVAI